MGRYALAISEAAPSQAITLAVLIAAENLAHIALPALLGCLAGIVAAMVFHHAIIRFAHVATDAGRDMVDDIRGDEHHTNPDII